MLVQSDEARAEALMKLAKKDVKGRWDLYRQMAAMHYEGDGDGEGNGNGHEQGND
jgi:hypothetical protein